MRSVYKYPIRFDDTLTLSLPVGAQFLSVQTQQGGLCLWALVDTRPDVPKRDYTLHCRGTGHPVGEDVGRYINTIQVQNGALIFHFFCGAGEAT